MAGNFREPGGSFLWAPIPFSFPEDAWFVVCFGCGGLGVEYIFKRDSALTVSGLFFSNAAGASLCIFPSHFSMTELAGKRGGRWLPATGTAAR